MEFSEIAPEAFPEYTEWRRGWQTTMDAEDFVKAHVSPTAAIFLTTMLFPKLIEVRECILLQASYNAEYFDQWWTTFDGDRRRVERSVNRVILWDRFEIESDADERAMELLAERMVATWRLTVEQRYPDREFDVEISDDYGPTVTLCRAAER